MQVVLQTGETLTVNYGSDAMGNCLIELANQLERKIMLVVIYFAREEEISDITGGEIFVKVHFAWFNEVVPSVLFTLAPQQVNRSKSVKVSSAAGREKRGQNVHLISKLSIGGEKSPGNCMCHP